jgi:hypothetical protein
LKSNREAARPENTWPHRHTPCYPAHQSARRLCLPAEAQVCRALQGIVHEVRPSQLVLKDGVVLDFGLCVWSTGVGPTAFIESLPFAKTNVGRLAVNAHMQVLIEKDQVMLQAH